MSIHVDERPDGGYAVYIDGDLQFDTSDEAVYHESLALPALCLASHPRRINNLEAPPVLGAGGAVPPVMGAMRVLICGGGDGLALREVLRFPAVSHVDLVDYSPEVVDLGRTRIAATNRRAFEDSRVTVHVQDAWAFLTRTTDHGPPRNPRSVVCGASPVIRGPSSHLSPLTSHLAYNVVICDFTVPRRPEDTRVFSREWYELVAGVLAPGGVAAINGVSPQATPEAFWCLRRTVRAAGLSPLPYRVCIPSFRAHGYGAWAFLLASREPLRLQDLRALACPVPTLQADLTRLWRGARFSRAERALERRVPVNTLDNSALLPLLLNPGCLAGESSAVSRQSPVLSSPGSGLSPLTSHLSPESPLHPAFDLDRLIRSIPILHPSHTREMVETLAEQVAGAIRSLDIRRLVEALLKRAKELPGDLVRELRKLRAFLRDHAPTVDWLQPWGCRLFAALVITMTLANAIAPDNAFAKGGHGLGHSAFSRGYTGGFAGGRGSAAPHTAFSPTGHVSFGGFRSHSYGHGMTDVYGFPYRTRTFYYYGGGYHHYYGVHTAGPRPTRPEQHKAVFVADEDTIVLDNGDVIVTLSDTAYLLVSGGSVTFMSNQAPDPLIPLYPEPRLFDDLTAELHGEKEYVRQEMVPRVDWLSWVGWTSALFPEVADDKAELRNMQDLDRRLDLAIARVGAAHPKPEAPVALGPDEVELFVGGILQPDYTIALHRPDDGWLVTDGRSMWPRGAETQKKPCPPLLSAALKSVLAKLSKEFVADIASDNNDLSQLATDRNNLNSDLSQYQSLYASNGYDPNYSVDYGDEEISVSSAISRTQGDLAQNDADTRSTIADRDKTTRSLHLLDTAIQRFGK